MLLVNHLQIINGYAHREEKIDVCMRNQYFKSFFNFLIIITESTYFFKKPLINSRNYFGCAILILYSETNKVDEGVAFKDQVL